MAKLYSLVNYSAQRLCLGSNIFAYHKDLLFVFDLEIICFVYIKIYDDLLYGLHNFVITYNNPKLWQDINFKILYLVLQHCHVDFNLP